MQWTDQKSKLKLCFKIKERDWNVTLIENKIFYLLPLGSIDGLH